MTDDITPDPPTAAPPPPPPPPPTAATAGPPLPPPPGPPAAPPGTTSTDFLTSLDVTPSAVVRAVVVGALTYVAAWVASLLLVVLLVVLAFVEDEGSDVSWWWLLTGPGQLVAAAFRSPAVLTVTSSNDSFGTLGSTVSSTVSLLTLLAVALVAVFRLSRRDEATSPTESTKAASTLAVVTAVVFVVVALLVALVLKVSFDADGDSARLGAGRIQLVLYGLPVVAVVALFGRRPWHSWATLASIPPSVRAAWRAALVHLAVFSALAVPTGAIWLIVEGEAGALLAVPALVGNALVWAVTLGHLGALSATGFGGFLGSVDSDSSTYWAFGSDTDKIVWLLVAFAVVSVLASAVVLHERGKDAARTNAHWVWAVVVYGGVGAALTLLGTVSAGFGSSVGVGAGASFGPAPWFILVLAAWGGLAELGARVVGPALSGALPAAWVARAVGRVGPVRVSAPPAVGASPSAPIDPTTKKLLIGAGGAVAVVVVGLIGVSVANSVFFGPEKQVERYFTALADGKAEEAISGARLDYSTDERVLLTDEVLGESGGTIRDVEISDVQKQGDFATASVSYTIDGADQDQDVTLRTSGSRLLFFDEWELVDPDLGSIYVSAEGATGLEVNGRTIDVDGLDEGVSLAAFPGEYEVTPVSGSRFLTFEAQSATVGTSSESLDFDLAASDDLLAEVTKQADAYLATCIARTEADPSGCPNTTYRYGLEDVVWTLDAAPTYTLETDYDGGWRVTTDRPGSATVTAKEPSIFDDEPDADYTDTIEIDLTGSARIDGDTVTFEPAPYY